MKIKKIEIEQCNDDVHTGELIQNLVEAPKYKVGVRKASNDSGNRTKSYGPSSRK